MAIYLSLGEKAGSFSDSSLKFSIIKGQVAKVPSRYKSVGKIRKALNGGHIIEVTSKEYEEYLAGYEEMLKANHKDAARKNLKVFQKSEEVLASSNKEVEEEEEDEKEEISADSVAEDVVKDYSIGELKAKAKELGVEFKNNMNKIQIANAIIDFLSMEDEEDDEE